MSGTGGGGSGLYSALKSLQFPEIDKFTPDSLDWLFEDPASKEMWTWISKNVTQENYVDEDTIETFNQIPRGEVVVGSVLEAALESSKDEDPDLSNEDLEHQIAQLEAQLGWNEESLETMNLAKKRVIEKTDIESLALGSLRSELERETAEERRTQEHVLQINAQYNEVLRAISSTLEALIGEFSLDPGPQVHLYNLDLEQLERREQELDVQVSGLITAMFGSRFNQLGMSVSIPIQDTDSSVGLINLGSDTCLELVRGRDKAEFRHLQSEIKRVRMSIYRAEIKRIETEAKSAGVLASLDVLTRHLGLSRPAKPSMAGPTKPNMGAQEDEDKLNHKIASLVAECVSCYCDRILTTDYKLKYRRSLFIINKMESIREMLLSRRARQEILDTLMLNETDQILHIPTTINQLKLNLDDTQKRTERFSSAALNLGGGRVAPPTSADGSSVESGTLIPEEDTPFINLYKILRISGDVDQLATYPGVQTALNKLVSEQQKLEDGLNNRLTARLDKLEELGSGVRNLTTRGLHLDIHSQKRLSLVPREVYRAISALEKGMKELEIKLMNLVTDWQKNKAEMKTKPYYRQQRTLWIDFILRPQLIAANVRAVENKSKN